MLELTTQPIFPENSGTGWSEFLIKISHWFQELAWWQKFVGLIYLLILGLTSFGWYQLRHSLSKLDSNIETQTNLIQTFQTDLIESPRTPSISANLASNSSVTRNDITVHLAGAVRKPGVYSLVAGSLLADAIKAAGGLSGLVWQDYLDQFINLAEPLVANQKIWIPSINQQTLVFGLNQTASSTSLDQPDLTTTLDLTSDGSNKVSINQASLAELMELNGIGQKRAEDIIAGRPYIAIEELTSKAKVSASVVAAIAAQLEL